jgi:hypothetical protein
LRLSSGDNDNAARGGQQVLNLGEKTATTDREEALARAFLLLGRHKNVHQLTFPAVGFPRVRLMGYVNVGWQIEFSSGLGSKKSQELLADPRTTFLWSGSHVPEEPMRVMVQLDCVARVTEGEEKVRLYERRVARSGGRFGEMVERRGIDGMTGWIAEPRRLRVQGILGGEETFVFRSFPPR